MHVPASDLDFRYRRVSGPAAGVSATKAAVLDSWSGGFWSRGGRGRDGARTRCFFFFLPFHVALALVLARAGRADMTAGQEQTRRPLFGATQLRFFVSLFVVGRHDETRYSPSSFSTAGPTEQLVHPERCFVLIPPRLNVFFFSFSSPRRGRRRFKARAAEASS